MTQLNQAIVLLTGASGGFGQEFTRQLLQAGSRLILTDRDQSLLSQFIGTLDLEQVPGEVLGFGAFDLATRQGCEQLYQWAQGQVRELEKQKDPEQAGTIDILVNNAGIGLWGRLDEVPLQQWEQVMQVNLLTPMDLCSRFMADMIARRQGHIVNIASLAGWYVPVGLSVYGASKFGLRGFSEGLWRSLKHHNIQVTTAYPFFSRTPILQAQQYGSLAQTTVLPEYLITEPNQVIKRILQAIRHNQRQVFPDLVAQLIYLGRGLLP
jgi:short-subunit dehydrogenase